MEFTIPTPLRIYQNIPEFLKHRQLTLDSGHLSIAKGDKRKALSGYLSDSDFIKAIQSDGAIVIEASDSPDRVRNVDFPNLKFKTLIVIFDDDPKFTGVVSVRAIINKLDLPKYLKKYNVDLMLVSRVGPSSHIIKEIEKTENELSVPTGKLRIRHIKYTFLASIRPNHVCFPAHRVISAEERSQLFDDIKTDNIPKIYSTDVGVIWSPAELGDVIELSFVSESVGLEKNYKKVVKPPSKEQ